MLISQRSTYLPGKTTPKSTYFLETMYIHGYIEIIKIVKCKNKKIYITSFWLFFRRINFFFKNNEMHKTELFITELFTTEFLLRKFVTLSKKEMKMKKNTSFFD